LQKDYGQQSQIILTMPILEGTDGVQKMSKSYGNYIGINEPPQEIYGKVMSISDELMWRYYELLTDKKMAEIEQMKSGMHPMDAKKQLAAQIVRDFHGDQAAQQAGENWARQFQKDEVPENVESQSIPFENVRSGSAANQSGFEPVIRMDKLLVLAGLADSSTDAQRKRKQGAVRIDDKVIEDHALIWDRPAGSEFVLRVGRRIKRIKLN
jgi:tyrosyl-tRNA synthetase